MSAEAQKARFARQMIIPAVGEAGQEKLRRAKVLVIGAGGLGSPVLCYLVAAGVGTIGIADHDCVEISNLQRQVLYVTADLGKKKTDAAESKLRALNPETEIKKFPFIIDRENLPEILADYEMVIDCSDNFATRYTISDITCQAAKPMIYGAVFQFYGQLSVFNFNRGPSYRDLFPAELNAGDSGDPPGVIGALPGIIGSMQACEAIKIILGTGEVLSGKLLQVDALNLRMELITI